MTTQARERDYDERDDELSAIARSLHREWDSPRLWPSIAAAILAHELAIEAGFDGAIEVGGGGRGNELPA